MNSIEISRIKMEELSPEKRADILLTCCHFHDIQLSLFKIMNDPDQRIIGRSESITVFGVVTALITHSIGVFHPSESVFKSFVQSHYPTGDINLKIRIEHIKDEGIKVQLKSLFVQLNELLDQRFNQTSKSENQCN